MEETKEELLSKILHDEGTDARNIMGCNESWYDSYYAIAHTFTEDELKSMSLSELHHLIKLGDTIAENLY